MARPDTSQTLIFGLPIKYISLVILVVQNSALVLTMRYSRILPGPRYLTSTAVLLSETLKCAISIAVHVYQQNAQNSSTTLDGETPARYSVSQLFDDVFGRKSSYISLLIPAGLYTLQNNLQFVAASNLDAATFQVAYQSKILTTAVFAVTLLRQSLSPRKWLSLLLLTAGVALVQVPSGSSTKTTQGNWAIGMLAVATACVLSGLAGVYFEKILKGSSASIWLRNIQLGSASIVIAAIGAFVWDGKAIHEQGFFQGYNRVVVATIGVQAAGGLIVALVIKYADNILKGFATSLSIILSTIASTFIFDFVITSFFLLGAILVLGATYLYSLPDAPKTPAGESAEALLSELSEEKDRFAEGIQPAVRSWRKTLSNFR